MTWNFQGYLRNSKWNFQGLIKNNVEFPGVIMKKSCGHQEIFWPRVPPKRNKAAYLFFQKQEGS